MMFDHNPLGSLFLMNAIHLEKSRADAPANPLSPDLLPASLPNPFRAIARLFRHRAEDQALPAPAPAATSHTPTLPRRHRAPHYQASLALRPSDAAALANP